MDPGSCLKRTADQKKVLFPLLLIVFAFVSSAVAQTVPPNIIVILADDLGYGDVGFNGCQDIPTPNIDSLAANGVRCSNAYIAHPFCSPSRAALLTGRYQQRFGFENNPDVAEDNPRLGISLDELLISDLLKPNGYVCGAIGKWHVGYATNLRPIARGFDSFYGFLDSLSTYFNAELFRDDTPGVIEMEYLTDAFSREAESFIRYSRHSTVSPLPGVQRTARPSPDDSELSGQGSLHPKRPPPDLGGDDRCTRRWCGTSAAGTSRPKIC